MAEEEIRTQVKIKRSSHPQLYDLLLTIDPYSRAEWVRALASMALLSRAEAPAGKVLTTETAVPITADDIPPKEDETDAEVQPAGEEEVAPEQSEREKQHAKRLNQLSSMKGTLFSDF